jgi:hypothetical protein
MVHEAPRLKGHLRLRLRRSFAMVLAMSVSRQQCRASRDITGPLRRDEGRVRFFCVPRACMATFSYTPMLEGSCDDAWYREVV